MMAIWIGSPVGSPKTRFMPSAIWEAPRPREVVVPKRVAMIAKTSMALPNHPSMSLPRTGRSIGDTRPGRFLRWVE